MYKKVNTPLTEEIIDQLNAGDLVLLSGEIYTARDEAHKRMIESLKKGRELPFEIKNSIIYYVGPCPPKPGQVVGSCGPTTSGRMDKYTPVLIELGLKGMIGKGYRSKEVIEAMKRYKAVYFTAIGGAGALLAQKVKKAEIVAYEDLGTEAIYKFFVENFPVIVTIDIYGNNLYDIERKKYKTNLKR
ncbi:hydro-lyase, Fe-S type, tartrate/fumarate subfamily, beta subunit [Thermoanaerobacter mathranii subsp. mathranii str. A3]|jgi:fumarate hydratase subunit beta|uniref:Fumarate hydratase subunit beta n=2 Tax=Thermoanaerobacter TaxID=1754 RepID=A0ABT9M6C0_9THEO|nr:MULTISPECIES: Fe-S-containing hydro-lyase [Thermoanaerobacter]ADH59908.1 hydro-lyase, Fe-S type, tartrate/fumarate subfamily, beta subunit [Thermoanaerobacter mathranii subsp. mathranii str. A3]MBT1279543.1 Fe-S-containing hydro-lyase [Thermoanaerobacter sp. CM-CNRG TB177]MDK2814545.1 fumarate hydratase subunit beta [Thermoanaerobacter sp.]MDP9751679.1 fumarate hydratase subunit beta [Thermoanaerobacter pentosaceus]